MSAVPPAIVKAFGQLGDRAFARDAARCVASAVLAAALAGCGGGGSKPASVSRAATRPAPRVMAASMPRPIRTAAPVVTAPAGLEGVIGVPAAALTGRFGAPRIDLFEGDARKLQFAGRACVLDVYLYPLTASDPEPTAIHVEARQRQGGAPADPAACIREVEGERAVR